MSQLRRVCSDRLPSFPAILTFLAIVFVLAAQTARAADDTVKKVTKDSVRGKITAMSKNDVTMEKGGNTEKVPVVEIDDIRFDTEPPNLNSIRNTISNGAFENALKALGNIDPAKAERDYVKQDIQFYKALARARLALGGAADIRKAGQEMGEFVNANPDNYHFYEANTILGDLLVAAERYDAARKFYATVAEAPFPEYKMQAGVASGRALVAQGKDDKAKFAEAIKEFDAVITLAEKSSGPVADSQRHAAMLGKANCLAETEQPDEGIKLAEEVIAKLPPEEKDLHAQAYNALGNCYKKKPDGAKPALLAFLHVDVLYTSNTQAHAEALWNLALLWNQVNKPERALQCTTLLKERYANSFWARR